MHMNSLIVADVVCSFNEFRVALGTDRLFSFT